MKILRKILSIVLNIVIAILSILIIIAVIYAVQTKIQHKSNANIFGYTAFEVVTGSMSGTIEIGDLVIVKITKNIEVNDIVVYEEGNHFVTHRVLEINREQLITKGDANNSQDVPITSSQILGKVTAVIPKIGIWKRVFTTPSVLIAMVITTLLITAIVYYHPPKKK